MDSTNIECRECGAAISGYGSLLMHLTQKHGQSDQVARKEIKKAKDRAYQAAKRTAAAPEDKALAGAIIAGDVTFEDAVTGLLTGKAEEQIVAEAKGFVLKRYSSAAIAAMPDSKMIIKAIERAGGHLAYSTRDGKVNVTTTQDMIDRVDAALKAAKVANGKAAQPTAKAAEYVVVATKAAPPAKAASDVPAGMTVRALLATKGIDPKAHSMKVAGHADDGRVELVCTCGGWAQTVDKRPQGYKGHDAHLLSLVAA